MSERHLVVRQIYATSAVLAVVATFMPLFASATPGDPYLSMTLWSAIGLEGGSAALVGVVLVLAIAAAAVVGAAHREHGFAVPAGVLALGALALLMLLLRPGTGSPAPSFGPGAGLLLGTTLVVMATALTDALMTPVSVTRDA